MSTASTASTATLLERFKNGYNSARKGNRVAPTKEGNTESSRKDAWTTYKNPLSQSQFPKESTQGGKGKRKPSEYNLFMKKKYAEIKKAHPNMEAKEIFKKAAGEWKKKN
jgi:HMG (high mobility group) box